jgi:hypothetical protein
VLKDDDNQLIISFLELIQNMIDFRNIDVIENSSLVSAELLRFINSKHSKVRHILFRDLLKYLAGYDYELKSLDYTRFKWQETGIGSKQSKHGQAIFEYHELDSTLLISMKLFEIFKTIVSSNQSTLNNLMKNTFSLGYLLELNMYAKEIYPLKKVLIQMISYLYVNDKISLRNLDGMCKELKGHLLADLREFEANNTRKEGMRDKNVIFYSKY